MIKVVAEINAKTEKVWDYWTNPEHIVNWTFASSDWHCPFAENDLRTNGKFKTRMEAKDGSMGFDFEGIYTNVIENQLIEYVLADNRKIIIEFKEYENCVKIIEKFDPEDENSLELQEQGWQSILNNFKKYVDEN